MKPRLVPGETNLINLWFPPVTHGLFRFKIPDGGSPLFGLKIPKFCYASLGLTIPGWWIGGMSPQVAITSPWSRYRHCTSLPSLSGDNGVDNQTLLAVNEAIASHPVEAGRIGARHRDDWLKHGCTRSVLCASLCQVVGRELRGHMTAMKKIAVGEWKQFFDRKSGAGDRDGWASRGDSGRM